MPSQYATPVATPRRARAVGVMLAVATVVGAVLVSPYLPLDADASRVDVGGGPHYALLVTHVFTALVALVLGPVQFLPGLRARRRIHRVVGRLYLLAGVVPSALAAVPVALLSGRPVTQVGLTVPAVLWLVTAALAYRAIRRGDVARHREWMMRNYALTFLAVTSRVLVPLLLLAQVVLTDLDGGAVGERAPSTIPVGQALGWVVDLVVVEVVIRRGRG